MNKLLLFCSACLLSLPVYAQQLSITSKHKTKTFPADTHFELGIQFTAGIGFTAFNKTKKYRVGATESKWQLQ